jgi:hypothetical protein
VGLEISLADTAGNLGQASGLINHISVLVLQQVPEELLLLLLGGIFCPLSSGGEKKDTKIKYRGTKMELIRPVTSVFLHE